MGGRVEAGRVGGWVELGLVKVVVERANVVAGMVVQVMVMVEAGWGTGEEGTEKEVPCKQEHEAMLQGVMIF
jgi:hypothetical protein